LWRVVVDQAEVPDERRNLTGRIDTANIEAAERGRLCTCEVRNDGITSTMKSLAAPQI